MSKYLRYRPGGQRLFQMGDGTAYFTVPRSNISLVEVQDEHVGFLLMQRCGCCGNQYACFSVATEDEITRWLNAEE